MWRSRECPGHPSSGPAAEGVGEAGRLPKSRARCAGGASAAASGAGAAAAERRAPGPEAEARRWAAPAAPAAAVQRTDRTAAAGSAGDGAAREPSPAGGAAVPDLRIWRVGFRAQPEGRAVGSRPSHLAGGVSGSLRPSTDPQSRASPHNNNIDVHQALSAQLVSVASILQGHRRTHAWDFRQGRVPARMMQGEIHPGCCCRGRSRLTEEAARTRCSSEAVSGDIGRPRAATAPAGVAGAGAGAAAEARQASGVSCGCGGDAPCASGVAGWGTATMGDGLQGSNQLHVGLVEACTESQPCGDAQALT